MLHFIVAAWFKALYPKLQRLCDIFTILPYSYLTSSIMDSLSFYIKSFLFSFWDVMFVKAEVLLINFFSNTHSNKQHNIRLHCLPTCPLKSSHLPPPKDRLTTALKKQVLKPLTNLNIFPLHTHTPKTYAHIHLSYMLAYTHMHTKTYNYILLQQSFPW